MTWIKEIPKGNYYAVIFSSAKTEQLDGYAEMDEKTLALAMQQKGFLGYESVSHQNTGIFISYWESKGAIQDWAQHSVHQLAKGKAKQWYKRYLSQICLVETTTYFKQ